MERFGKKIITILLSISMLMTFTPTVAFATDLGSYDGQDVTEEVTEPSVDLENETVTEEPTGDLEDETVAEEPSAEPLSTEETAEPTAVPNEGATEPVVEETPTRDVTPVTIPANGKFMVRISSQPKTPDAEVGAVTGIVYDDFKGVLTIGEGLVNRDNLRVEVWMQNVESLGITDARSFVRDIATGMVNAGDNDLTPVMSLFAGFNSATVIGQVEGGDSVTYTVAKDGRVITATPESAEKASTVWHEIVNDSHVETVVDEDDESSALIKAGSYIQIDDKILIATTDVNIDNLDNMGTLSGIIRNAVEYRDADKPITGVKAYLVKGSELNLGMTRAKVKADCMTVTANIQATQQMKAALAALQSPGDTSQLVTAIYRCITEFCAAMNGTTTTVNVAFDHQWGEQEYAWSADHTTCTATAQCMTDPNHAPLTETVNAEKATAANAFPFNGTTTTYTAKFTNECFAEQTYVDPGTYEDFKFAVSVSSRASNGNVGTVTGIVYPNYQGVLTIGEGNVSDTNVTVDVWMKDVASLNVEGVRHYTRSLNTGIELGADHSLDTVEKLFKGLEEATVIAKVDGGSAVTYTIVNNGRVITATPGKEANARKVWHEIVNDTHVQAGTDNDDNSYAVIKKGSFLQVDDMMLIATSDVTVDNLDNLTALNTAIRDAVEYKKADQPIQGVKLYLTKDTELNMGSSYAKVLSDCMTITADVQATQAMKDVLSGLKSAENVNDMIVAAFNGITEFCNAINETSTTVTFSFNHKMIEHEAVAATCEEAGNIAYYECQNCGKLFSDEAGTTELTVDPVIPAIGHAWGDPTYTWSADYKTCTAERVCGNDNNHKQTETVNSTFKVENKPFPYNGTVTTYTAEFTNDAFAKQTKDVPQDGQDYKFAISVSSTDSVGHIGTVNGIVYTNYQGVLTIGEGNVSDSNVTVDVWMKNVASLNVGNERHYTRSLLTGVAVPADHSLDTVNNLFNGLEEATVIAKVEGGHTVTYTITNSGRTITANPNSENSARSVWHEIVNEQNIEAGTKEDDNSSALIKKGSYIQVEDMILIADSDVVVDNMDDLEALNTAIRNAVTYRKADKAIEGVKVFVAEGTILNMGTSYAKWTRNCMSITADVPATTEMQEALAGLKSAERPEDMILAAFNGIEQFCNAINDKTTTVTFSFGHKLVAHPEVAATCLEPGNTAYWECENCGKFFSDAEGTHEIEKDSWITPATDHVWGEPTYTWTADHKKCTAERVCTKDPAHKETETVDAVITTAEEGFPFNGKVTTYTVTFENSAFATDPFVDNTESQDFKFAVSISSVVGENTGSVTGIVYPNYQAVLSINGENVSKDNVTVGVWMKNVESLGVEGVRSYIRSLNTGMDASVTSLDWVENLFAGLHEATVIAKVENGHTVTYTVTNTGRTITANPNSENSARSVWHEIVNQENINYGTDDTDDSSALIKAGSYIQVKDMILIADQDVVVDNLDNLTALNTAIREAVTYKKADKEIEGVKVFVAQGTRLDMGTSFAEWNQKCMAIDIDVAATDEMQAALAGLKGATNAEEMILAAFDGITEFCNAIDDTTTTVVFSFEHKLTHYDRVEAACETEGNIEYWQCENCGKLFSDEDCTHEVTAEEIVIAATGHLHLTETAATEANCTVAGNIQYWTCDACGKIFSDAAAEHEITQEDTVIAVIPDAHDWGEPTYAWSKDHTECVAVRICRNNPGHIETENADVTIKTDAEGFPFNGEVTTYTATFTNDAFENQKYVDTKASQDFKFAVSVSSAVGENTGSVTGIVYPNYQAVLSINGENVSKDNVTVGVWMKNVESLGVEGVRSYIRSLNTGMDPSVTSLDWVENLFAGLHEATVIAKVENGHTVTYTVTNTGRTITANPNSENSARSVWHEIVNQENINYGTDDTDDSSALIKAGSYIQVKDMILIADQDVVVDNLDNLTALNTAIREAVTYKKADKEIEGVKVFVAQGTRLDMGTSFAEWNKNCMAIDIDVAATDEMQAALAGLKGATNAEEMILAAFDGITEFCNAIDDTTTTVVFSFGHKLIAHEAVEATCEEAGNTAYWECENCGLFFSDANGETKIEKDSWIQPKLGHDWDNPTYTWAADLSTCTAERVCKRDASHVETETVEAKSTVVYDEFPMDGSITTYTATFENDAFATQTETRATGSHDYKFAVSVSSESADGTTGSVTGIVYPNYQGVLSINGDTVSKSNLTVGVWMKDVESLGVEGVRSYVRALNTGMPASDTPLTWVVNLFNGLQEATVIAKVENGHTVTYTVVNEGRKITATPASENNARSVWHEIVNTDNITYGTKRAADDSKALIKAGSYIQIEDKILIADQDVVVDNLDDLNALNAAIRDAVTYKTADKAIEGVKVFIAQGTRLDLGSSFAEWNKKCMSIDIDVAATDEMQAALAGLKDATGAEDMILAAFGGVSAFCTAINDTTTTVEFSFDHKLIEHEAVAETCTEDGNTAYWECENCGLFFSDAEGTHEIAEDSWLTEALGHDWDITYEWSDDNSMVTANAICQRDNSHTVTETAKTTVETTDATCLVGGQSVYTATFTKEPFTVQTKTVDIDAIGHDWGEPTYEWSADFSTCTATRICNNDPSHIETKTVETTSVTVDPTATTNGSITYTADFDEPFEDQTHVVELPATGYTYGDPTYDWSDTNNTCTATIVSNEEPTQTVTETVETTWTWKDGKEPTCTEGATKVYTAHFAGEKFADQTKEVEVPALGHDLVKTEAKEATCEEAGNTAYWTCQRCGEIFGEEAATTVIVLADTVIPATGHVWGTPVYTWSENLDKVVGVAICQKNPAHMIVETVDVTKTTVTDNFPESGTVTTYFADFTKEPFTDQTRTEGTPSQDYKFAVSVSSESANGTTGSVTGIVYPNYQGVLSINGDTVSKSNVTVGVWMKNVESLGVEGVRSYIRTINTGMPASNTSLSIVETMLSGLHEATVIGKVEGGSSVTYTVVNEGRKITATPASENNARAVWHEIVNEQNINYGIDDTDDSSALIKAGSYIQVENMTLIADKDVVVDNLNDLNALNAAIRDAVTYKTADKAIEGVKVYVAQGTRLDLGTSYAEWNQNCMSITADVPATDEMKNALAAVKNASGAEDMILAAFNGVSAFCTAIDGTTTTVVFSFGHDWGEPTYEWNEDHTVCTATVICNNDPEHKQTENGTITSEETTAATCEDEGVMTYTATFENELFETQTDTAATPKLGHDWDTPTYTWAADYSTCTAIRVCKRDASHVETETVDAVPSVTSQDAFPHDGYVTTYTADFENPAFETQTADVKTDSNDYKFAVSVSSESQNGTTGSVTGIVYPNYQGVLSINGDTVSKSNVTVGVWMNNVASLGVDGERSYIRTINTGMGESNTPLTIVEALFSGLHEATVIGKVEGGSSVTYTVTNEGRKIYANPNSENSARAVWHEIVNTDNIEAGIKSDDDSSAVIKKGSYIQVEDKILLAEKDVVVDNLNDLEALNAAIRDAVVYKTADKPIEGVKAYVAEGTILNLGTSYAKWTRNCMSITADVPATQAMMDALAGLQGAGGVSEMMAAVFTGISEFCTAIDGKTTTVVFSFGHKLVEIEAVAATCEEGGNNAYYVCENCGEYFKDAEGNTTTTPEAEEIEALGHLWGEPTYTWAADFSTCTAIRICQRDPSHIEVKTVNTTSQTVDPTNTENGKITYTADFDEPFEDQTHEVVIPATGHEWNDPEYTWAEDNSTCTATMTCKDDPTLTVTETVDTTWEWVEGKEATCTEPGQKIYTAYFGNERFEDQTKTVDVPALGHDWAEPKYEWNTDHTACVATSICNNDNSHTLTENATVTSAETTAPTCEGEGVMTYTATFPNETVEGLFETQTYTEAIQPTGHAWGTPVYTWSDDLTTAVAVVICGNNPAHIIAEKVTVNSTTTDPTCEAAGQTVYTADFTNELFEDQTKTVEIPATGHDWGEPTYTWAEDNSTVTAERVCANDPTHKETETVQTTSKLVEPTCTEDGYTEYTATFENDAFKTVTKQVKGEPATGHNWGEPVWTWTETETGYTATATFTCLNDANHVHVETAEVTVEPGVDEDTYTATVIGPDGETYTDELIVEVEYDDILRIFGYNRFATAFKNADKLKETLGIEKFDTIVVATGANFPDSLSGAYLANVKNAPILLISAAEAEKVRNYINDNLNAGGMIYILGGEKAVDSSWLEGLNCTMKRLSGPNRYDTNYKILQEVGYTGGDIMVATGLNYPDSLSASSLDMPILLVSGDNLRDDQVTLLNGLATAPNFYIAGGKTAVSEAMEGVLGGYGTIAKRFAGKNRYETSKLIAEEFFKSPDMAILAVGSNFPDGLTVGPLAAKKKAPILLTDNEKRAEQSAEYCDEHFIRTGYVIGGATLIWDSTAKDTLNNDTIVIYEEDMYTKPLPDDLED